jgi:hypothetical protein
MNTPELVALTGMRPETIDLLRTRRTIHGDIGPIDYADSELAAIWPAFAGDGVAILVVRGRFFDFMNPDDLDADPTLLDTARRLGAAAAGPMLIAHSETPAGLAVDIFEIPPGRRLFQFAAVRGLFGDFELPDAAWRDEWAQLGVIEFAPSLAPAAAPARRRRAKALANRS